jgi:hypothetical protein
MAQLFSTPIWFNGWDLLFNSIILLVALLIAGYSWRIYRLGKTKKYGYFSLAFLSIGFGLFFKMVTNAIAVFQPVNYAAQSVIGSVAGSALSYGNLYFHFGFLLQMIPILGGLLLIFFISQKSRERLNKWHEVSQIALFIYLVVLVSVVANFVAAVFYLTSSVILSLIVLNYYKNYLNKNNNKNALQVMLSFFFMLLGNLFIVFVFLAPALYVVGEVFMLIGFILLLSVYMRVRR